MSKGKLITIEAGDGSGKATQTKALYDRLLAEGYQVLKVEYPDYQSESSALVRMYLGGEFGQQAENVSAYGASAFFAVDRYASYLLKWRQAYESGWIILADRYTTSNMVHQAVKLKNPVEREEFLTWLWDFEFGRLQLPVPDRVIYLDMPPEISDRLINSRAAKDSSRQKDIHEKDTSYLHHCHRAYNEVAEKYGWVKISCAQQGNLRTVQDIHEDVYQAVKEILRDENY